MTVCDLSTVLPILSISSLRPNGKKLDWLAYTAIFEMNIKK